jgi:hypothetical protein
MTGGYVSAVFPPAIWASPIVRSIYGAPLPPFPGREVRAFAAARHVDVVMLRSGWPGPWRAVLSAGLGRPREGGGMLVWRVRGEWPRSLGSLR